MAYQTGARVLVNLDGLQGLSAEVRAAHPTASGRVLQRCGPEAYDVLLDEPLTREVTLLSWVPEALLRPVE